MKQLKFIPVFLSVLFNFSAIAQTVQGTVLHGSSASSVYISMKPDADLTGSLTDFQVTIAIPAAPFGAAPTYTFTPLITGLSLGVSAQSVTLESVGGVSSYVYTFSSAGTGVASVTYAAGTVYNIAEVSFSSPSAVNTTLQLVQIPNGGSTGQSNFFVAFNNNADATNQTTPFFGVAAANDGQGYAGFSFVPLSNIVLPVKFLGFNATKKNNDAVLTWQIENETSLTDHYEIEKSANGVDFKKISSVPAKNNGSSTNTYDFNDVNLFTVRSGGVIYYRIKQIDKDGKSVSTPVRNLRLDTRAMAINVYPNPIRDNANLSIDLVKNEEVVLTINDASGKQVQNISWTLFKGLNVKKINMSNLASGNYMLKVSTGSEIKTIPLVKTR
ncbi:MAG: T9SS type A sorting domain-containing protein [Ferruginibacter sp.]